MKTEELQQLLDDPIETLPNEYKSFVDTSDPAHRAKLARHIAAISNYGGGAIILGFEDDLSISAKIQTAKEINRDFIASVTKKYLEPPPACEVHHVTSSAGDQHPIILVPAHGKVPICTKASGPDETGKPIGISQGTYYLRKPGPASEPILNAGEWNELIRRCVLHDRAALLSALSGALDPKAEEQEDAEAQLKKWHDSTQSAFEAKLPEKVTRKQINTDHFHFSYLIDRDSNAPLEFVDFPREVSTINNEVRQFVSTGWSMFYVFNSPINPYWNQDQSSGLDDDTFLECSLVEHETYGDASDFWRLSPDGRASLIRDFWEDGRSNQNERGPDRKLDAWLLGRTVGEFVHHARAFSSRFDDARGVAFL